MHYRVIALAVLAAIPGLADSRFHITIMPRPELAPGKGQCDIRLEIDNDVRVTIRRDLVLVHTLSGEDARDDGSDCNVPLPAGEMKNFAVQPVDSRSEIHILDRPGVGNDYALILRITDAAAGFGRYHFRLSWDAAPAPTAAANPPRAPKQNDYDRPNAPEGFVWNNAVNYKGHGAGESVLNERTTQPLGDVRADIDLGGKIVVSFRAEQPRGLRGSPRPVLFTGSVMTREGSRIRADMITEDRRLHGTMTLSVDDSHNINSITMNATDGQDHLHLTWDRR
jgi:hypothetical protein